ncbi:MAG: hypothetical protein ATN35_02100 [Epulopiscium sp. Nele67-Bin004]|nr:MAG: hypothetical protein ATN35_02100 [Epulopiscium sp. Nele67-Bin004]
MALGTTIIVVATTYKKVIGVYCICMTPLVIKAASKQLEGNYPKFIKNEIELYFCGQKNNVDTNEN